MAFDVTVEPDEISTDKAIIYDDKERMVNALEKMAAVSTNSNIHKQSDKRIADALEVIAENGIGSSEEYATKEELADYAKTSQLNSYINKNETSGGNLAVSFRLIQTTSNQSVKFSVSDLVQYMTVANHLSAGKAVLFVCGTGSGVNAKYTVYTATEAGLDMNTYRYFVKIYNPTVVNSNLKEITLYQTYGIGVQSFESDYIYL